MRVAWRRDGRSWSLRLRLDPDETLTGTGQGGATIELVAHTCTVTIPDSLPAPAEPHPDLLGLAACLVVRPWVGQSLIVDRPVSPDLAEALTEASSLDIGPVDDALPGRRPGQQVGVSYSSGVDSVALAELLGCGEPLIHLRRVPHPWVPNRATHIRADQLALLASRAERHGWQVAIAHSDMEYLCRPWPQYPTWPAVAVAAVLLADQLGLGGLGFGSVLESVYLMGGRRFRRAGAGPWAAPLAAVGLPLCRPTAGLTEVGTSLVAHRSPLRGLAQSCLLGAAGHPCLGCVKCVRKELLESARSGSPVPVSIRERLASGDPAAKDFFGEPPLHMQNITEYVVARVPGLAGTVLGRLAERMDVSIGLTSWNERYYPPALTDEVPAAWRYRLETRLRELVPFMEANDIEAVETFDGARRLAPQALARNSPISS